MTDHFIPPDHDLECDEETCLVHEHKGYRRCQGYCAVRDGVDASDTPKRDDGGPAFPFVVPGGDGADIHEQGMSLRDHFAAAALQAIVSQKLLNPCGDFVADDGLLQHWQAAENASRTAYRFADAMLAERAK